MTGLPPEYLDRATPADVDVTDRVRTRYPDPTLGVPLPDAGADTAAHPLVTVGDSLTHGMSSGAVSRGELAWPGMVADCLGVDLPGPSYGGPLGGLPFNIEGLLRRLQDRFGDRLNPLELVALPLELHHLVDANEDYWERGDGAAAPPLTRFANVGIYGWDVRDCLSYTAGVAAARLAASPPHDDLLGAIPSNDSDIAARSVLGAFGPSAAQIDAARWFGTNGGIGTLIVAHGANNALRSVVDKNPVWSDTGYDTLDGKDGYTVWRPTHFALEYGRLVDAVRSIDAHRVLLATVPHVTVAPIANGVNPDAPGRKWRDGSRYFPYYTDPWIAEADFRPAKHRHLTHQQARAIDSAIDQYNATIADAVRQARSEGRHWYLLDLCGRARRPRAAPLHRRRRGGPPQRLRPVRAPACTERPRHPVLPFGPIGPPAGRAVRPRRGAPDGQRLRRADRRGPRRARRRRRRAEEPARLRRTAPPRHPQLDPTRADDHGVRPGHAVPEPARLAPSGLTGARLRSGRGDRRPERRRHAVAEHDMVRRAPGEPAIPAAATRSSSRASTSAVRSGHGG